MGICISSLSFTVYCRFLCNQTGVELSWSLTYFNLYVLAGSYITVELVDKSVKVNPDMAIFITMNPGYAGRSNLPDNLKKLFRSLAMTQPDRQLIAQVMLYSQGFRQAETLASKIVPFFKSVFFVLLFLCLTYNLVYHVGLPCWFTMLVYHVGLPCCNQEIIFNFSFIKTTTLMMLNCGRCVWQLVEGLSQKSTV